jgi:hypothetical protein
MSLIDMKKKNIFFVVMFAVCLLAGNLVSAGESASVAVDDRNSQFERAAVNYEWAAQAQHDASAAMLAEARVLRSKQHKSTAEYQRNMRRAGDRESRAGDLEMSAAGNYDNAAKSWGRIRNNGAKTSGSSRADNAQMSDAARANATMCYQRAAEIYELAAQAYYIAKDPLKQASLNQKAARMRERLAQRI